MFLRIDGVGVMSVAKADLDRDFAAGRASLIQFGHFPLTETQAEAIKQPGARIVLGIDHLTIRI